GVTIPSQRRYVEYYSELVRTRAQYNPQTLVLNSLELEPVPTFNGGTCTPFFMLWSAGAKMSKLYSSPVIDVRKGSSGPLHFSVTCPIALHGDIKVEVYNKPKMMKKEKMFQFWFNTFFVPPCGGQGDVPHSNGVAGGAELRVHNGDEERHKLVLYKEDLDKAYKDTQHSKFSRDFKVSLLFVPRSHLSPSTAAAGACGDDPGSDLDGHGSESDTTDDDDWESQETTHV
ncbi:hypothetical protein HPB47_003975, partial [Ixodes persulcatus]